MPFDNPNQGIRSRSNNRFWNSSKTEIESRRAEFLISVIHRHGATDDSFGQGLRGDQRVVHRAIEAIEQLQAGMAARYANGIA